MPAILTPTAFAPVRGALRATMGLPPRNRRVGVSSTPNDEPMPGTKTPMARVVALDALLILLGVALRGRMPGVTSTDPDRPTGGVATLLGVMALVVVSTLVIAVAIVMSLREPGRGMPSARYDVPGGGAGRGRRRWRVLLIGVAAVAAWLLLNALLAQLRWPQYRGAPSSPPTATPHTDAVPRPPAPPPGPADDHVFWILATATGVLTVLILGAGLWVRLRRPVADPGTALPPARVGLASVTPAAESLALAAERGLAEVGDLSREPREAIIACYAAMEAALASAPGAAPQESDTPSEVLARAVQHDAIHADSATELVTLFAEARFSTHVMNEGHREVAEHALREVLDELRSAV